MAAPAYEDQYWSGEPVYDAPAAAPPAGMNAAGAASDPFAYTQGSLLTPWTETFNYGGPATPAGGYYGGSPGYSPLAPFQYEDFSYNFKPVEAFSDTGQFVAPSQFKYSEGAFRAPEGSEVPRYTAPDKFAFTKEDLYSDPSYDFRFQQGRRALENSAAAKGMLRSGNTWKALEDYGQGAASQEYQAAWNRAKSSYDTAAELGLAAYDRNFQAADTTYGRAASEYDRRYSQATSEYDRNFQNSFNVYNANFANALNAWRQNADVNLAGQGLGFNIATGQWDRNYNKAFQGYQSQVQQAEAAAQMAAADAAAAAASAQWADSTNYNRALGQYEMRYNQFQNNQANQFNRLYALAGLGQGSANTLTGAAGQFGGNAGNLATSAGNAGAAGQMGSANAWAGALGNAGNTASNSLMWAALLAPRPLTAQAPQPGTGWE